MALLTHSLRIAPERLAGGAASRRSLPLRQRPASPALRSLQRWVIDHLGSIGHEKRVLELAEDLFELLQPLHGLGADDRELLCRAAIVHDVGRCISDEEHPAEGARMIRCEASLPLSATERSELALLTRRHRGKPPASPPADRLPAARFPKWLKVLAILKAADALDSRSLRSGDVDPPLASFSLAERRSATPVLHIFVTMTEENAKARKVYSRRKKFRLLESALGCRVETHVACAAGSLRIAA